MSDYIDVPRYADAIRKGDDPEAVLRIAVADVRRVSLLEAAQMVDGWHLGERSSKFRYDVLERIAAALREAADRG